MLILEAPREFSSHYKGTWDDHDSHLKGRKRRNYSSQHKSGRWWTTVTMMVMVVVVMARTGISHLQYEL